MRVVAFARGPFLNYYIADGGTQRGPFTLDQLSSQAIRADTLVWCEGMPQWEPAVRVPALAHLVSTAAGGPLSYAAPPGMSPPLSPPPDISGTKVAAGICGILFGTFGVHKFILGLTGGAVAMLCISLAGILAGVGCACLFPPALALVFAPGVMHVIGIIEGIIYLTRTDAEFYRLYLVQKKQWF